MYMYMYMYMSMSMYMYMYIHPYFFIPERTFLEEILCSQYLDQIIINNTLKTNATDIEARTWNKTVWKHSRYKIATWNRQLKTRTLLEKKSGVESFGKQR